MIVPRRAAPSPAVPRLAGQTATAPKSRCVFALPRLAEPCLAVPRHALTNFRASEEARRVCHARPCPAKPSLAPPSKLQRPVSRCVFAMPCLAMPSPASPRRANCNGSEKPLCVCLAEPRQAKPCPAAPCRALPLCRTRERMRCEKLRQSPPRPAKHRPATSDFARPRPLPRTLSDARCVDKATPSQTKLFRALPYLDSLVIALSI
jgi:hypothetical protein